MSLYSAIEEAVAGDPEALASVYANSRIAVIEAIYKTGHITKISAEVDETGSVTQHGQSMKDINRNALKHINKPPAYRRRLEAEALNTHRIEDLIRNNVLEKNWLFIPSLYPDDMTEEEAARNGFFVNTHTNVIQAITTEENEYQLESAFLEGDSDGGTQSVDAIKRLYNYFGYDVDSLSVTELLATPLIIPKTLMPNGLVDIVKLIDQINGNSFFGSETFEFSGDYESYVAMCRLREQNLESTTDEVVEELLSSDSIDGPVGAVVKLYDIVRNKVVTRAIYDTSIASDTFGVKAEEHILEGRKILESGDMSRFEVVKNKAIDEAIVSMCGIGNSEGSLNQVGNYNIGDSETVDNNTGQIKCINCRKVVSKKDVVKPKSWCCPLCKYEVDVCSGKVLNGGKVETVADKKPTHLEEEIVTEPVEAEEIGVAA